MRARAGTSAATAIGVLLAAAGCGVPTVADLPLPGGAAGGPSYHVTVEFADVLDLVRHSAVRVNDVTVGEVEDISLAGWSARIRIRIANHVRLPDNATAAVRQTSLLGEKFVSLAEPATEPATGSLSDGDVIPLSRTRRSAEVEEVFAALGLFLNGGGLTNAKTIIHEVSVALDGNEAAAKSLLHQLDTFLGGLDAQKDSIARAIDALDRLLTKVANQRTVLGSAIDATGPALAALNEERTRLTAALTALGDLGTVGTRVVTASRDEILTVLRSLQPVLDKLAAAGDNLPRALDSMFTIVFPPNVTEAIRDGFFKLNVNVRPTTMGRWNPTPVLAPAASPQSLDLTLRRGTIADALRGGLRG